MIVKWARHTAHTCGGGGGHTCALVSCAVYQSVFCTCTSILFNFSEELITTSVRN